MIERKQIPVADLTIDTAQSRRGEWEADEQDQRLVHSLETDGLLQSLLVRPVESTGYDADSVDADYSIIAGSRRYHAAVEAGFEYIGQHWTGGECESVSPPSPTAPGEGSITFYTDKQVYDYLAREHLGSERKVRRVRKLIQVAELPDELQALWKQPDLRTAEEREALEKFNIDRDLTAERGGSVSRLGNQVLQLHRTIEEHTDADAVNTTNATLETIGRLDVGDMSSVDLEEELQQFKTEIKEVGEKDTAAAQERAFRARLENHETQLRELNEELDSPALGRLNFRLEDQRYKRYHARAKQTLGVKSNSKAVRKGYRRYLEQQAEKHDW